MAQDDMQEKFDAFIPGMLGQDVETTYQYLEGRVFTVTVNHADGSRSLGETTAQVLRDLAGRELREGFYTALGEYVGEELPNSL